MVKRIIALFLVCILAVPILVIPASATELDHLEDIDTNTTHIDMLLEQWVEAWSYAKDEFIEWMRATDLGDFAENLLDMWQGFQDDMKAKLQSLHDDMKSSISTTVSNLATNILQMWQGFQDDMKSKLQTLHDAMYQKVNDFKIAVSNSFYILEQNITAFKSTVSAYFERLLNGEDEQVAESEDFRDEVNQQETQFDEMQDVISTSPTISFEIIDDIELDQDMGYDGTYVSGLQRFFNVEIVFILVAYSLVFGTISYVIYGKR